MQPAQLAEVQLESYAAMRRWHQDHKSPWLVWQVARSSTVWASTGTLSIQDMQHIATLN